MRILLVLLIAALSAGCNKDKAEAAAPTAAKPAPKPPKPWTPQPFVLTGDKIEWKDAGISIERFFSMFNDKVGAAAKDEFETTEEFEKRIADADRVLAPISTNAEYAFLINVGGATYNADKKTFKPISEMHCYNTLHFDALSCKIRESVESSGSYTGSNAFGAERQVARREETAYHLVFEGPAARSKAFKGEREYPDVDLTCPVPVEKAKLVKDQVRFLIVGQVTAAKTYFDLEYGRPTYGDPRDVTITHRGIPFRITKIVCFAQSSGEVLDVKEFD